MSFPPIRGLCFAFVLALVSLTSQPNPATVRADDGDKLDHKISEDEDRIRLVTPRLRLGH